MWRFGGWRAGRWQGGDGGGAGMVPRRGRGVEARVWSNCFCFLFLFLSDQGDVWVEGGEASSAGHGQEAGKTGSCIYAMAAKRPYAI
jgi:hypothetical protein